VVITLSRQAGCGGEETAQLAAERLGIQVADRTILERIAQHEGLPVEDLAVFDDVAPGAIEAVIAEWRTSVNQAVYLRRVAHALLLLEHEDNVLIMGRGAAFVLTDPGTLHVRVIAPMPCRVARLVQKKGLSAAEAERALKRSDEARVRFVRQVFGADIDSPSHYDLVINTAELAFEEATEMVVVAASRKAARRAVATETPEDFLSHLLHFRRRPRFPRVSETTWQHCRRHLRPSRF
jgi:cytidylate kinase